MELFIPINSTIEKIYSVGGQEKRPGRQSLVAIRLYDIQSSEFSNPTSSEFGIRYSQNGEPSLQWMLAAHFGNNFGHRRRSTRIWAF